jgi:hypothetical protein
MSIIHEKPVKDYDHFIQDGSVLSKVMTSIVFNSVPLEQIDDNWGVVSLTLSSLLRCYTIEVLFLNILTIVPLALQLYSYKNNGNFALVKHL